MSPKIESGFLMVGFGLVLAAYGKLTGKFEPFLVYMGLIMAVFLLDVLNLALFKGKH